MMSAIYVANVTHSSSSKGIEGRGTATPVVERDRGDIICHYCVRTARSQKNSPFPPSTSSSKTNGSNGMDSSDRRGRDSVANTGASVVVHSSHASRRPTSEGGGHTTTRQTKAASTVKLRSTLAATLTSSAPTTLESRVSAVLMTPETGDDLVRLYIAFTATEVKFLDTPGTGNQNEGTWPFCPSPVALT